MEQIQDVEKTLNHLSLRKLLKLWLLMKLRKERTIEVVEVRVNDYNLLNEIKEKHDEATKQFVQKLINELESRLNKNVIDRYTSVRINYNNHNYFIKKKCADDVGEYFKKQGFIFKCEKDSYSGELILSVKF